jgi:hypothetical protein
VNSLFRHSGADQDGGLPSDYGNVHSQPPITTHPLLDATSVDVDAGATLPAGGTLHAGGTQDAGGTLRIKALRLAHMLALVMYDCTVSHSLV